MASSSSWDWKMFLLLGLIYSIPFALILPHPVLRAIAFGGILQLVILTMGSTATPLLRLPFAGSFATYTALCGLAVGEHMGGVLGSFATIVVSHLEMLLCRPFLRVEIKVLPSFLLHTVLIAGFCFIAPSIITIPELPSDRLGWIIGEYLAVNAGNPLFYGICTAMLMGMLWTTLSCTGSDHGN